MKHPFLAAASAAASCAGLIVLAGCETMLDVMDALNEAHTYNSSAIAGGGAEAGKDYITGLAASTDARAYFAKAQTESAQTRRTTVTRGNDNGTGVTWTDDGGIVIPPGATIEFANKGYCMDPHLPAPKSGEEMQFVRTASLLPAKARGTYNNLMRRAAAGDKEVQQNLQRLVWALRTAGSKDVMATHLTDRQKQILEECSSSEFAGIDSLDGLFDRLVSEAKSQLAQTIADATSVRIGNFTYNAFDLMDPDKGMEKVAAHMDALVAMSKNLPVSKTGFNFGQIGNGIFTDIKGNGVLSFNAKIANSTSLPYTFYPLEYATQVGSGKDSKSGTFYASSSTSMRQRTTMNVPDSVVVVVGTTSTADQSCVGPAKTDVSRFDVQTARKLNPAAVAKDKSQAAADAFAESLKNKPIKPCEEWYSWEVPIIDGPDKGMYLTEPVRAVLMDNNSGSSVGYVPALVRPTNSEVGDLWHSQPNSDVFSAADADYVAKGNRLGLYDQTTGRKAILTPETLQKYEKQYGKQFWNKEPYSKDIQSGNMRIEGVRIE